MTTNDDNREQAVPCKICTTPTLMQGTKLCDRCYEIESRARLYPDDVEQVLNYLGWRVKTPAALLREAEAVTAPDVSDADGWYKKFTSWFGVNEYDKICHLLALKERPDCITEVAEYVFENAFSEYIAALRAARKREGALTQALADAKAERDHMTEIASQRLAHETRMRIERDALCADLASARAELASVKDERDLLLARWPTEEKFTSVTSTGRPGQGVDYSRTHVEAMQQGADESAKSSKLVGQSEPRF